MHRLSLFTVILISGIATRSLAQPGVEHINGDTRAPIPPQTPPAAMTIEGEVRTVDSAGHTRLWGKGRGNAAVRYGETGIETGLCTSVDGTVKYGLSRGEVNWGSAADACPAGTWVCNVSDFGVLGFTCDTARPDSGSDAYSCDGTAIDRPEDDHFGWIADTGTLPETMLYILCAEQNSWANVYQSCEYYPVWCCSEAPCLNQTAYFWPSVIRKLRNEPETFFRTTTHFPVPPECSIV